MLALLLISRVLISGAFAAPPPVDPHDALCAELRRGHASAAAIAALGTASRPSEICHFEEVVWRDNTWVWVLAGMMTAGVSMLAFPEGWGSGHYHTRVTELLPIEMGLLSRRPEIVEALLAAGADPEAELSWERRPLELALALAQPDEKGKAADPSFALAHALLAHGVSAASLDGQLWESTAIWMVKSPVYGELRAAGLPLDLVDKVQKSVLYDAAEARDGAAVSILLSAGANPNGPRDYTRPILAAIEVGDAGIVGQLLAAGASPTDGSPLEKAVAVGRPELADLLVAAGADPRAELAFDRTLLHVAVQGSSASALDWVLAHGVAVDALSRTDGTPLALAVCREDLGFAKTLLAHGADPALALPAAASCENAAATGLLLGAMAPSRRAEVLPGALRAAIESGAREVLAVLLDHGASLSPGPGGWEDAGPIGWAAHHGEWKMVDALLQRGASIDARDNAGRNALSQALYYTDLEAADALVKRGASLGEGEDLALQAAGYGAIDMLEWLSRHGVPMDHPSPQGWTPLSNAVAHREDKATLWLVAHGAEVDRRTPAGATLLVESVGQDYAPCRDALLASGANPNAQDATGQSALSLALTRQDEASVAALLKAGAWPDRPDGAGQQPLLLAMAHGTAFDALVEAGAGKAFTAEHPLSLPMASAGYAPYLDLAGVPYVLPFTLEEAILQGEDDAALLVLSKGAVLFPEHLRLAVRTDHVDALPWMFACIGVPEGAERRALMREARKAGLRREVREALNSVGP